MKLRVIDHASVTRLLDYRTCTGLMREAMMSLARGESPKVKRSGLPIGDHGLFGMMPGYLGGAAPVFGAKLLGIFSDPVNPGYSRHQGVVVLFEGTTGMPVCVADGETVTAIRTASATAAATEALARPDARRLAIFGTGTQAYSHVAALTALRQYDQILVWGRDAGRAVAFAKRIAADFGIAARGAPADEAAGDSDVICTVTAASEPILKGAWVRSGTHVNAVGSSIAGPVEIDNDLVAASRFIVDSTPSALDQAAEFLRAKAAGLIDNSHIAAEIGEVFLGTKPGRTRPADITLYKSLGHIVQDLAAVRYLAQMETGQ